MRLLLLRRRRQRLLLLRRQRLLLRLRLRRPLWWWCWRGQWWRRCWRRLLLLLPLLPRVILGPCLLTCFFGRFRLRLGCTLCLCLRCTGSFGGGNLQGCQGESAVTIGIRAILTVPILVHVLTLVLIFVTEQISAAWSRCGRTPQTARVELQR